MTICLNFWIITTTVKLWRDETVISVMLTYLIWVPCRAYFVLYLFVYLFFCLRVVSRTNGTNCRTFITPQPPPTDLMCIGCTGGWGGGIFQYPRAYADMGHLSRTSRPTVFFFFFLSRLTPARRQNGFPYISRIGPR